MYFKIRHLYTCTFLLSFLFFSHSLPAQIGGKKAYQFLSLPYNARVAGLGGINITLLQKDVNMFLQNPALMEQENSKQFSLNYTNFYAGINYTALAYAQHCKKLNGMLGFGLQYLNYGTMEETDATGTVLGTFTANDFAMSVAYSHKYKNFLFGGTVKLLGSQLASYNAYALGFDFGAVFKHPEKDFTVGIAIKNIGFSLKNYTPEKQSPLPLDAQIGVSFKPSGMPFRFSFTLHHLQKWNIAYEQNVNQDFQEAGFLDQFARHLVIGGELLIHKAFQVRFGYNHLINRELKLAEVTKLVGFSIGFALKTKAFEFAYSRGSYHAAGGRNYLTLSLNFNTLLKKK